MEPLTHEQLEPLIRAILFKLNSMRGTVTRDHLERIAKQAARKLGGRSRKSWLSAVNRMEYLSLLNTSNLNWPHPCGCDSCKNKEK